MMETRLFLFPVSGAVRSADGDGASPTSFLGAIAVRQTWPHFQVPPDPRLITRFLFTLLPSQSLFVMALQRGVNREDVLAYLRDRSLAYHVKEESVDFEGPIGFSLLSHLWGRQLVDSQFIFRSVARDDLDWAIRRYGSLDRLRIFAVTHSQAEEVQDRLAKPSSEISYDNLLDQSQFVALFDYDWDYFFCFSRRMPVGQLVNSFRTVCQHEGVGAETVTERVLLRKAFRRAEKLLGLPMLKAHQTRNSPGE